MKAACKHIQIDANMRFFGMFVVYLPRTSQEIYGKGGKKTRWDNDVDELAGEGDAEYDEEEDAEEEEELEADAVIEPDCSQPLPENVPAVSVSLVPASVSLVPASVSLVPESVSPVPESVSPVPESVSPVPESVSPVPASVSPVPASVSPALSKLEPLALRSSSSLAPTELETPDRERPALADRMLPYDEGKLTPTPVSPPPSVIVKEVVLVVDSPKKVVKAEIPQDEASEGVAPVVAETSGSIPSKVEAMRELALLEAQLLNSQLLVRRYGCHVYLIVVGYPGCHKVATDVCEGPKAASFTQLAITHATLCVLCCLVCRMVCQCSFLCHVYGHLPV